MKKIYESLYNKRRISVSAIVLNFLIILMIAVIAFEVWFRINYNGIYVVQTSMYPTLVGAADENEPGGNYLYADKYAKPERGDIVVVKSRENKLIIKRLIALGGDYVKLDKGVLYIKYKGENEFKLIEENYVHVDCNDPYNTNNTFPSSKNTTFYGGDIVGDAVRVYEGYIFVMGDNRNVSFDSRQSGAFLMSDVYGVVTDWSFKHKDFLTKYHKFVAFDLPAKLGIK